MTAADVLALVERLRGARVQMASERVRARYAAARDQARDEAVDG